MRKLKKKKVKKRPIDRTMEAYYQQFTGTLPEKYAHSEDALQVKIVIEGGVDVGWRLLKDARVAKDFHMEREIRESFIEARKRINVYIELMETEKEGITIG